MYVPKAFAVEDRELVAKVIREHSFAVLITVGAAEPHITHLPLLYDTERNCLRGHMAKANPHGLALEAGPSVAVFRGPHAYVSSRWYESSPNVPTWNYVAVHAHGAARVLDAGLSAETLREMIGFYDPDLQERGLDEAERAYFDRILPGIVAFELEIERVEGKFKLSQNKSDADRSRVVAQLAAGDSEAQEVAALMRVVGSSGDRTIVN